MPKKYDLDKLAEEIRSAGSIDSVAEMLRNKLGDEAAESYKKFAENFEQEPKTKRYLLFGIDTYYPAGGLSDCQAASNDLEELKEKAKHVLPYDFIFIVDMEQENEDGIPGVEVWSRRS